MPALLVTVTLAPRAWSAVDRALGLNGYVVFHTPPTAMGPVTIAVLDDTCGSLIRLYQV